ncbi:MAG TPA: 4Fe-4S dicluster domain-containing protein [Gemmatirosa sp.]
MKRTDRWTPSAEQKALWPPVSGNTINGVGEAEVRRPSPIYWHAPDATPHGALQLWFIQRTTPLVQKARQERQAAIDAAVAPVAPEAIEQNAAAWSRAVKIAALGSGADVVGITRVQPQWVFEGHAVAQRWAIMLGVAHDWAALRTAPEEAAAAEVIRQYARGIRAAKGVASMIRAQGHDAVPHGGPMAYPMLLVPAAIAAGLGELGKHGSLINRTLGSNLRLACVLTDVPLVEDGVDDFGADDFCARCQACTTACPPQAIGPEKQVVRGEQRWYVDFDRCLPFFNEHQGCAVCLSVCPWNHPGVAPNLVRKLAARRERAASDAPGMASVAIPGSGVAATPRACSSSV